MQRNLALLREGSWFDLPILFVGGQRALITFEKGIPGDKVFEVRPGRVGTMRSRVEIGAALSPALRRSRRPARASCDQTLLAHEAGEAGIAAGVQAAGLLEKRGKVSAKARRLSSSSRSGCARTNSAEGLAG